jgi:hypothetical protein
MAIYTRFGTPVRLVRPVTTLREVQKIENRVPDQHDSQRIDLGMYCIGRLIDEGAETQEDRLFDLGLLRADDGIAEINKAARAVGCNPK